MIAFLFFALFSTALGFLFPTTGCNCGCPTGPICPPPPVCPPVPACPAPLPSSGCCSTCVRKCRTKREISKNATTSEQLSMSASIPPSSSEERQTRFKEPLLPTESSASAEDETSDYSVQCNSEDLRQIIIANVDRVTSVAKKKIQSAAEQLLEGRFNVICSRGDFSYITSTELYCQHTVGDVTCYVFKQLSDVTKRNKLF